MSTFKQFIAVGKNPAQIGDITWSQDTTESIVIGNIAYKNPCWVTNEVLSSDGLYCMKIKGIKDEENALSKNQIYNIYIAATTDENTKHVNKQLLGQMNSEEEKTFYFSPREGLNSIRIEKLRDTMDLLTETTIELSLPNFSLSSYENTNAVTTGGDFISKLGIHANVPEAIIFIDGSAIKTHGYHYEYNAPNSNYYLSSIVPTDGNVSFIIDCQLDSKPDFSIPDVEGTAPNEDSDSNVSDEESSSSSSENTESIDNTLQD